jgi:curved DNA-binding protein CbpA
MICGFANPLPSMFRKLSGEMAKTHYQSLGIAPTATPAEVKSAYRALVMQHHPDRSRDPKSPAIFLEIQAAYEVLGDAPRRRDYDAILKRRSNPAPSPPAAPRASTRPTATAPPRQPNMPPPVAAEIMRLSKIFGQGRQAESIDLARAIIERDPRQPLPYAVLGDIARGRGDINQAAKWYAYAAQFDPRNETYQRRYEELLMGSQVVTTRSGHTMVSNPQSTSALVTAIILALSLSVCSMFPRGPEAEAIQAILGFLAGTFLGGALAIGWWIDRLSATLRSHGLFMLLALANVGASLGLYLLFSVATKGFNRSLSGWFGVVVPAWILFGLLALAGGQATSLVVLTVIPSAIALGGLCGWAIGDALR